MDARELDRLGDEIAELSVHLEAATARLLDLIREFDAWGGWNNGFRSCAAWLSWRVGFAPGAAREHVRVARALGMLPRLSQALARGELSYAKVRELTRVATPETEERLLAVGRAGTTEHVERIVRGWRRMDRKAEMREAARQHAGRSLHVHPDEDGTVRIRGRLVPEVGALLLKALAAAREALYQRQHDQTLDGDPPTMEQQQADALAMLAEAALHHGVDPGAPGERYQVVVHVDAAVLADADQPGQSVLEDGLRVPAGTSQRLACDASRVVMRHDADGRLLEIGARTRTIPPALRRALQHRDHGCRFPGCGLPFGQGHHIRHWRRAVQPRFQIWPCFVADIIAQFTRRAIRSSGCRTANCSSADRTAGRCPTCHRLRWWPAIPQKSSELATRRMGSPYTHAQRCLDGSGNR